MCYEVGMKKTINSVSAWFYDRWIELSKRQNNNSSWKQMERELKSLNPGINGEATIRNYYINKIHACLLGMGVCGIVLVVSVCNVLMNGDLKEGRYLKKEGVGGEAKEVKLHAEIGEMKIKDILVEVDEKKLSDDEIKQYLHTVGEQLPEKILGENESLQQVEESLVLMTSWEDTEISLFWNSSNHNIIQEDGTLLNENIAEEGVEVTLTAFLFWENIRTEKSIPVTVYPKSISKEELVKEDLLHLIEEIERGNETDEYVVLPETWNQTRIFWKEDKAPIVFIMLGLMVVTVFGISWGKDQDIHKLYKIRNRQLELEYSEFVSKLQLLISSGVSIRGAFVRLAKEYTKRRKQGGKRKYVYEELLLVVRKMEGGMNEIEAYQYFARRCDLICYKKLVAIITQNVKRGTDGLKESLNAEIRNAFEMRKQETKKLGEEAGTKLLLPMMMMMGIVLIIIVVPAYFSFGGI